VPHIPPAPAPAAATGPRPLGVPPASSLLGEPAGGGVPLPRLLAGRDAERMRRYRELLELHEGRRSTARAAGRERALTFNYARALVEKGVAYLATGHAPEVQSLGDGAAAARRAVAAQRVLDEAWERNALERLDLETEIDTAVLGDGAFKVVWDEREGRAVVSAPDVQGLFAWWLGDDVRRLWRVASRYRLDADEVAARYGRVPGARPGARPTELEIVEAWTAERFELWAGEELLEERPNPYGVLPFVIYPNLPRPKQFWGVSDIEPVREPLAELNRALTQLSRILELSGNPIAVLENIEEARDIAVQPGAVWALPEQARAYLLDLLQGGGVRLHVDYVELVYRVLHDLAEVPRIAFGDARGDRSGVALRTELDPLLRRVERKRLVRSAALAERGRLILRVTEHHTGAALTGVRTSIRWAPSLAPGVLDGRAPAEGAASSAEPS
jgi:hypothetical protein